MEQKGIGKTEKETQIRIIRQLFNEMGYKHLGYWKDHPRHQPIEEDILYSFLTIEQGYSPNLAKKATEQLVKSATNLSNGLYEANKDVYKLLRYGVSVREELGQTKESVQFINWAEPLKNKFGFAEEVTVSGKYEKRPDIVIYVNGIALGIIELKRSKVSVSEGIRQNLDNQKPEFIQKFFTTMQFVMAGNDTEGLKYGTIETSEKYYLQWKEDSTEKYEYLIDKHISQLLQKERFLELIHDFVIFDKGTKKLARPNQYFGITAAHQNIRTRQGGIIWHTQGSGKSLTMVWLTKWIRENVKDSRVLIITDREELDDQIEKNFLGVDENIYRTSSGKDLLNILNEKKEWLICSLVHKFGRKSEEGDYDSFIEELKNNLGSDFKAKGDIYVFVDECHRTQSGKLHEAMKLILPEALFIGFTGTPLLKKDKQKSIEIFGPYIGNPYKFDEAVEDGVVLDLLYEARDVEQFITDQQSVDQWFEAETKGLNETVKLQIKQYWGTMQKVLGSKSRLEKIVFDIIKDFKIKPRLSTGEGNAMLVSSSVYQACKFYELFQNAGFKECAIITSYQPHISDIKGEETGEDSLTDNLLKYEVYTKMLGGKSTEVFESEVKNKFIYEPSKMKLLIVVDKLLTGFDAPSATYLYIDKKMQDHGLFQAICRVNRVDNEGKEYGFIIDYKDLFDSLKKSINDYTSGAFDDFDANDVKGLLSDRYEASRDRLESALETVIAICEPVHPKDEPNYIRYFCGNTEHPAELKATEERRVALYKAVVALIRAYANIANELHKIGYDDLRANQIRNQVQYYSDLRDTIKRASGDYVDLKRFEPGMRQLMDMYLDAKSSRKISDLDNKSLIELIVKLSKESEEEAEASRSSKRTAVAETIENNVRKVIIEESQTNPRYYERMSVLLNELIQQRKDETLEYEEYLKRITELAKNLSNTEDNTNYPPSLNTPARRALYDNLDQNESLSLAIDAVVHETKNEGWRDGGIKEKKVRIAVKSVLIDESRIDTIMNIIRAQSEY